MEDPQCRCRVVLTGVWLALLPVWEAVAPALRLVRSRRTADAERGWGAKRHTMDPLLD